MAELLYLCGRDGATATYTNEDLNEVARRIQPENAPTRTEIVRDGGIAYCIVNPSGSLPVRDRSVCMGAMIPAREEWYEPGTPVPDGSYGLVRTDAETVELCSDMTASRTLYYHRTEDLFVVSTSQRAVLHFADSYRPDERAIAWMVSSGTLGPSRSWDERIGCLPPDSRLRLDRSSWELTVTAGSADESFTPRELSKQRHRDRLRKSLDRTFDGLELDTSRWVLPLSGGLDSRELLFRLQDDPSLQTITWGTSAALEDSESDAVRAQELADACGVSHRYYTLPHQPADIGTVFERFMTAGEGRIDHFQGYTDGFRVFESLAADGVEGIVRGDEGFGMTHHDSKDPTHQAEVRDVVGARMVSDYRSLPALSVPGAESQQLPGRYAKHADESLEMWRDRLYHTYRIPVTLGALTALKTPYVEVVNPFLTRDILETVRSFPDEMRTGKQLYTEYVMERSPPVPVATRSPDPSIEAILGTSQARQFLRTELDTDHARSVLGTDLVAYTLDALRDDDPGTATRSDRQPIDAVKRTLGGLVPSAVTRRIVDHTPVERIGHTISERRLAFRLYSVQSMFEQLREDVRVL